MESRQSMDNTDTTITIEVLDTMIRNMTTMDIGRRGPGIQKMKTHPEAGTDTDIIGTVRVSKMTRRQTNQHQRGRTWMD